LPGGATGLGTAVEAASRGLRTLLVEKTDFAKGTSSRATKLAHGGVRYLEQGNISLVREALHERGLMLKNAPHLAHPLNFIIPAYHLLEIPEVRGFRRLPEKWTFYTGTSNRLSVH
jgi:glycerol-3-phosphate dehydrogenase